jgi:hypothetical protein
VDTRVGLDAVEKKNILYYRESNPSLPGRSPLLYQLSYPVFYEANGAYFKILSSHLPRRTEKNHKTSSRRANSLVEIQQETFTVKLYESTVGARYFPGLQD